MRYPTWSRPTGTTPCASRLAHYSCCGATLNARAVFGESLARSPNNAWALYGLAEAYAREGRRREARAVMRRFERAWIGETTRLNLATL